MKIAELPKIRGGTYNVISNHVDPFDIGVIWIALNTKPLTMVDAADIPFAPVIPVFWATCFLIEIKQKGTFVFRGECSICHIVVHGEVMQTSCIYVASLLDVRPTGNI